MKSKSKPTEFNPVTQFRKLKRFRRPLWCGRGRIGPWPHCGGQSSPCIRLTPGLVSPVSPILYPNSCLSEEHNLCEKYYPLTKAIIFSLHSLRFQYPYSRNLRGKFFSLLFRIWMKSDLAPWLVGIASRDGWVGRWRRWFELS